MPTYQNDMMHCSLKQCKQANQCYRYWLGQELKKRSDFQYASFYYSKEVPENCEYFIKIKN